MAPRTARSASRLCGGIRAGNSRGLTGASLHRAFACGPMLSAPLRSGQEKSAENTVVCDETVDRQWISHEDDVNEKCDTHESPTRGARLTPRAIAHLAHYSRTTIILNCTATS